MLTENDLLTWLGKSWPARPLLDVFLRLFDGHDIPAVMSTKRWHPVRHVRRRTLYAAHLRGHVLGGNYPYLGDERGTNHICFDVDAHNGETDAADIAKEIVRYVKPVCPRPLCITSKSGKGYHVYTFFETPAPTKEVFEAGREVVHAIGAKGRCDVIPSAGHAKGLGTLHGLPLHPPSASCGGGLVLEEFRPITSSDKVFERLTQAHEVRISAEVFTSTFCPSTVHQETPKLSGISSVVPNVTLLDAMIRHNPHFRDILTTMPGPSEGGRSVRDARIASALARQGVTEANIASALIQLPGTKASVRGEEYALNLARLAKDSRSSSIPAEGLAGTCCKSLLTRSPWYDRTPPPLTYGKYDNPWWRPDVRARMSKCRTRQVDSLVLAYLIDRWWQVVVCRKIGDGWLFEGTRSIAKYVKIPYRTVASSVRRLAEKFVDILHVELSSAHSYLRVANAFRVMSLGAGQSPQDGLYYIRDEHENTTVKHSRVPVQHAGA